MTSRAFVLIAILLFPALFSLHTFATFVPHQGDNFTYYEVTELGSGTGDYSGYTEQTTINGTENVNGIASNGTVSAHYSNSWDFSNSSGSTETGGSSGDFTFSSYTFAYINGTDVQTNYTNPTVWFCMDNSTPKDDTFYLLDTLMTVMSTNYSYYLPSQNRYVYAIYAQGNSEYPRNDVYGQFTATYTWKTYFDPSSGYIIGYDYTEHDTNPSGTGFTYAENLYVNSASYPLTTAPTPSFDIISDLMNNGVLIAAIIIIIAIILVISYAISRRRKLPKHPSQQPVYTPPSETPPPPPQDINLTPKQPPVQQIVIKEVVKVKCRYCGALIDSTAEKCPFCGAPRS